MKGILMMLKSLGVNIDPVEIETFINHMKVMIPQVLNTVRDKAESVDARLAAIERDVAALKSVSPFAQPIVQDSGPCRVISDEETTSQLAKERHEFLEEVTRG